MLHINDLLIDVKAKQSQRGEEKGLLIREMFLLWYAFIEGVECDNFSEPELTKMLHNCLERFDANFPDDADCMFMVGWVVTIGSWLFGTTFTEEEGPPMLMAAYKKQPANKLFKWASRDELRLSNKEITGLEMELRNNFYTYYNYGPYVKEYFIDVITTPIK